MLNKKYRNFLIVFIIVIIINLLIKNLSLSLICSCIFLFSALRYVLKLSKSNRESSYDNNQSYIICMIVLGLSIVWLIINFIMIALVSAIIKIIKELIIWILTFI